MEFVNVVTMWNCGIVDLVRLVYLKNNVGVMIHCWMT